MSSQAAVGKVVSQTAQKAILAKLIAFSLSLAVVPIASYFLSEKYVYNGNSSYAAITAVFAANGVLVLYILSSLKEDRDLTQSAERTKTNFESSKNK